MIDPTECDHESMKTWMESEIEHELVFQDIVQEVRCPECLATFKPTVDSYGGDVYLKQTNGKQVVEQ